MELFDDELKKETHKIGIHTKTPLPLADLPARDMIERVEAGVSELLKSKKLPVAIGGEHLISVGAVRAASQIYKDLSVLHLDAHHDLRNDYEGSSYNHACVARRFLEICHVAQVGMRSLSKEERDFLDTNPPNLKTIDAYYMRKKRSWKDRVIKSLKDNVYISLDLDIFDPSLMPSVGTPEPGGMGWYELLDLLKIVARNKKIIGFDIVELMPIKGIAAPDFLAAKLIYRLLGYVF
jgi:agmatinase